MGSPELSLRTDRLLLRGWRNDDLAAFAALNADPEVMRWFPTSLSGDESDRLAGRIGETLRRDGWGLWAVEVQGGARFIGFVGLARPSFEAHFTPAVEVGWRLAREHWGQGYATEAARAALEVGFGRAGLDEVVSFTTAGNRRSRRVMERLGMRRDPAEDFDHPSLAPGHPLRRHVLYRLSRAGFAADTQAGSSARSAAAARPR